MKYEITESKGIINTLTLGTDIDDLRRFIDGSNMEIVNEEMEFDVNQI